MASMITIGGMLSSTTHSAMAFGSPTKPRKRVKISTPQMTVKIIAVSLAVSSSACVQLLPLHAVEQRDDEDAEGAERARFGRRRPAEQHAVEDDADHEHDRERAGQRSEALAPGEAADRPAERPGCASAHDD